MINLSRNIIAASFLAGISAMPVSASASELSGTQIKQKINGKRVLLNTGYGVKFPLVYKTSGRVSGDGTGTGLGKYFAPKETGKWWIKGNQLCQQFPTWYKGETFCFKLESAGGNKLIWKRNDGKSGKATIG